MFSDLLAALKALGSAITWADQLRTEDRQRFARLCDDASAVLGQYASASEDRRRSINLCAELREYVPPIRRLGREALDSADLERVAAALDGVCDAWGSPGGEGGGTSRRTEQELEQIEAAAGMFRGLANRVRAA